MSAARRPTGWSAWTTRRSRSELDVSARPALTSVAVASTAAFITMLALHCAVAVLLVPLIWAL